MPSNINQSVEDHEDSDIDDYIDRHYSVIVGHGPACHGCGSVADYQMLDLHLQRPYDDSPEYYCQECVDQHYREWLDEGHGRLNPEI